MPSAAAIVPAVGLLIAVPAYIGAFFMSDLRLVFILWGIGAMAHYAYLGAQYNIGAGVVSSKSRATAIAILLIVVSIIGNGVGPYFVGFFSDFFTNSAIASAGMGGELSKAICQTTAETLTPEQISVCTEAGKTGLKYSISLTVCWFFVAAFCFFMSARTLQRDFVAELGGAKA